MARLNTIQRTIQPPALSRTAVFNIVDTNRIRISLIIAAAVLAIIYLWLVNSSATAGFYLTDLQNQVGSLESEFQQLQTEQASLESLPNLEAQSQQLSLVTSGAVDYVSTSHSVAISE